MPVVRARQYRNRVDPESVMLYGRAQSPYLSDVARPADYYVAGSRFDWLVQDGRITLTTQQAAVDGLRSMLSANGYTGITVNYGTASWWDALTGADPVYVLEVIAAQNIDRASAADVRNQVAQLAQAVGFSWDTAIQFNVERAGSPFSVGSTGSRQLWGDNTPVAPRSLGAELPDIWGAAIAPALTANWPIFAVVGIALVVVLKKL